MKCMKGKKDKKRKGWDWKVRGKLKKILGK